MTVVVAAIVMEVVNTAVNSSHYSLDRHGTVQES